MKVKELIEKLSKADQEREISVGISEGLSGTSGSERDYVSGPDKGKPAYRFKVFQTNRNVAIVLFRQDHVSEAFDKNLEREMKRGEALVL